MVAGVRLRHRGEFDLGEDEPAWKPFTSEQWVTTQRPGFVWDGRVVAAPGLAVHVHDAYVGGVGVLRPALAGLFTLADLRGTPALAEGELMRWLAEAAWYPTALLPSQGVRWEAVDAHAARATLEDGAVRVTLTFRFADDGTMTAARAEARGRTVDGRIVMTPWEGRWSNFQWIDGMRVPLDGEVAWLTPQGRKPYWRGSVTRLEVRFAR